MNINFTISRKMLVAAATAVLLFATLFVGGRAVAAASCFTDVDDAKWYEPFVCWAADNDIVSGFPDGTFRPAEPVTRAQVVAIAKRLADNGHPTIAVDSGSTGHVDTSGDTTWRDLPGASLIIDMPSFGALVTARFTAESMCEGGDYASVRMLLDGVPFAPAVSTDFAFDSSDGGTETSASWESHSREGYLTNVAAGVHTVKAQVNSGCDSFRIDDWTLVATSWPTGTFSPQSLIKPAASPDTDTQQR